MWCYLLICQKCYQANDIILKENDALLQTEHKQQNYFNEYFVHIADGVGEITDHYYGEGFYDNPSIKVIPANNGIKGEEDCLSLRLTNATQLQELFSSNIM